MKKQTLISCFALITAAGCALGAVSLNPYMYVGRVMDAKHIGFDDSRQVTFTVRSEDGKTVLVNSAETYLNPKGRDNYNLKIPMANESVSGVAIKGQTVNVEVTDNAGKKWSGVIADSTVGDSGGVREVDIVLGTDSNRDGIDDNLFDELEIQWEYSAYWVQGESFDPRRDYDGDGVSTIDEALSGTDPFDPNDVLKVISYVRNAAEGDELVFTGRAGRVYSVQATDSLSTQKWDRASFSTKETEGTKYYTQPNNQVRKNVTVFLYPASGKPSAFYRIISE